MEDPKLAKGLVKREVIRVVTPGTNLDVQSLEASKNNYLMCIAYTSDGIGISAADVTTGDYYVTEVEDLRKLKDELMKYEPSEIICNEAFLVSGYDVEDLKSRLHMSVSSLESHMFDDDGCRRILMRHFKVNTLIGLGVEEFPTGIWQQEHYCNIYMIPRRRIWNILLIFLPILPANTCCWTVPPEEIWN